MKIVGGILPYKDRAKMIEQSGTVTWSWFNIASGTVKWTLENNYNITKSFVLFRNSYYFGNAFCPGERVNTKQIIGLSFKSTTAMGAEFFEVPSSFSTSGLVKNFTSKSVLCK